jgi:hypothetical protein
MRCDTLRDLCFCGTSNTVWVYVGLGAPVAGTVWTWGVVLPVKVRHLSRHLVSDDGRPSGVVFSFYR